MSYNPQAGQRGNVDPLPYSPEEISALSRHYINDPSNVPCPKCGPRTIEVVCFLDTEAMQRGAAIQVSPDRTYTVMLYCHCCGRSAALDLCRAQSE
jgi:hypothetical protein